MERALISSFIPITLENEESSRSISNVELWIFLGLPYFRLGSVFGGRR